MSERYDAVVVGSGPNGLAAAITLARAGRSVLVLEGRDTPGGGARSDERTLPGFVHDVCSAIHPMAAASPFFETLELQKYGLEWVHPEVPFAQPLDRGDEAVLWRSVEKTAEGLGADGPTWRRIFGPLAKGFRRLRGILYDPPTKPPLHPVLMARFGLNALRGAFDFAEETFLEPRAKALFAGAAAHSCSALETPLTTALGMALTIQGHAVGWPAAKGGSQAITTALVKCLREHGGELRLGHRVRSLAELPDAKAYLFDTSPRMLSDVAKGALPERWHRKAQGYRLGPGVFKLDYALSGPMPWAAPGCRLAGTVHVGGTLLETARSERQVANGEVPEVPYVLVAQHSVFDDTRAPKGQHTLWAYCHVPNGCTVDMTSRIEAQLERYAPGFRDLVLKRVATSPQAFESYNPNYLGGDISNGALDGTQLLLRPWPSLNPWATPNPRLFLCSSATPPGPAVHGMCGVHAAKTALARTLA